MAPTTGEEAGYWVMVSNTATGEDHNLDRHRLAMAWIYGDVVHHDTARRQEADPFGLVDRFRAAVPLIAWAMIGTIELLNFTRALQKTASTGTRSCSAASAAATGPATAATEVLNWVHASYDSAKAERHGSGVDCSLVPRSTNRHYAFDSSFVLAMHAP
ncbi:hypothetical protein ACGFSG_25705 [Streptomyces sp. NPDC048512]|uniref:hypothetical protein n=1 Tax=unclassified Streptomyces TaxID=2593676 RepID=UPI0009C0A3FA|nr:hypothetical protein [Streptomyces sp. M41(2017)]OQQ13820.1 hypothetical protein B0675_26685 [Streptomyces sp. M41(2017)]